MGVLSGLRDWLTANPLRGPAPVISSSVSASTRLNLARELDIAGQRDQASSILWQLIETYPDDIGSYINLGDLWLRMGKPADALLLLQVAASKAPENSAVLCNLSAALSDTGNREDALVVANKAVECGRSNAMAYYNRAECWCALNQTRLSIRDYETAHELDPANYEIAEKLSLARIACMDVRQEIQTNFGDAKHESRAHGAWIVDGIEVAATLQCPHCGAQFVSVRGSGAQRMWCSSCGDLTCGAPQCNVCTPFRKELELQANLAEHQLM